MLNKNHVLMLAFALLFLCTPVLSNCNRCCSCNVRVQPSVIKPEAKKATPIIPDPIKLDSIKTIEESEALAAIEQQKTFAKEIDELEKEIEETSAALESQMSEPYHFNGEYEEEQNNKLLKLLSFVSQGKAIPDALISELSDIDNNRELFDHLLINASLHGRSRFKRRRKEQIINAIYNPPIPENSTY